MEHLDNRIWNVVFRHAGPGGPEGRPSPDPLASLGYVAGQTYAVPSRRTA